MPVATRRSKRLRAKAAAAARASEPGSNPLHEVPPQQPTMASPVKSERRRRPSMKEENDSPDGMPRSNEEFRHEVQSMLASPDRGTVPRKVAPSPRIDRITIQSENNENAMEFLIPPKRTSDAMEIRDQIRSALSSTDDGPETARPRQDVPVKDGATGLWSPEVPGFDQKKADRISKWLVAAICVILLGVFCAFYQAEIVETAGNGWAHSVEVGRTAWAQASEFAGKFGEWTSCSASSLWEVIQDAVEGLKGTEAEASEGNGSGSVDVDINTVDDSVTR